MKIRRSYSRLISTMLTVNCLFGRTSKLRVTGLCEGIHRIDSPHKGPVTRKTLQFTTSSRIFLDCVIYGVCCGLIFNRHKIDIKTDLLVYKSHRKYPTCRQNLIYGIDINSTPVDINDNLSQIKVLDLYSLPCMLFKCMSTLLSSTPFIL